MVGLADIGGSWLDKAGGEHLVVRTLQYQRIWGDLECIQSDEDISKVFWSMRSNTLTHHDIYKLHLTCCLTI
jgi:hypothetical protein